MVIVSPVSAKPRVTLGISWSRNALHLLSARLAMLYTLLSALAMLNTSSLLAVLSILAIKLPARDVSCKQLIIVAICQLSFPFNPIKCLTLHWPTARLSQQSVLFRKLSMF